MHLYKLTKLGKSAVRNDSGSKEELEVMSYIWNNGTASDDQLDVVGERYIVRELKRQGLIKELTEGE